MATGGRAGDRTGVGVICRVLWLGLLS
jgi:hypothetical protein